MPGLLALLNIASRALRAEQVGVEVTSHNIANVNTPGYSRQRVDLVTAPPVESAYGDMGNGVNVRAIERYFDPYLARRLDEKTGLQAYYDTQNDELEKIAEYFNETEADNFNDLLSKYWAAWEDLANNPTGRAERQAVLQGGLLLAENFNTRADDLIQQRMDLVNKIRVDIDAINDHAANIARLNGEIVTAEAGGHPANDLRDERQSELNQLAELVDINYFELGDGSINVMIRGGATLAEGVNAWNLDFSLDAADNVVVTWNGPNGYTKDITALINGGQLGAHIDVRDELIPRYLNELNTLAKDFMGEVNRVHSQGVGLTFYSNVSGTYGVAAPANTLMTDPSLPFGSEITPGTFTIAVDDAAGNHIETLTLTIDATTTLNSLAAAIDASPNLSAAVGAGNVLTISAVGTNTFGFADDTANVLMALGVNTFFTSQSGDLNNFAYTLGVNQALTADPNKVATGEIDALGNHPVGDNRAALLVAELQNQTVGPGGLTFGEAYQELVGEVGLDTQEAQLQTDFYTSVVDQLTQMRDAISGVSLDEELTALIKYQRAYQAAAKMVTVADELYQTLLSLKT